MPSRHLQLHIHSNQKVHMSVVQIFWAVVAAIAIAVTGAFLYSSPTDRKAADDAAALAALRAKQAKRQAEIDARPDVTIEFPKPSQLTR